MLKLEPMNPTDKPARSPFLNGVWEFLYTGGLGPGTLAVQVKIPRKMVVSFFLSWVKYIFDLNNPSTTFSA